VDIEWVNHASFVQRHGDVALLSDPWLSGTAFNDGWELLVPSLFTPADVASVTHIWFSHEHPDHFSPPVLKKIPAEVRERVQVVFQASPDQRVAKFCRSIGFTVQEVRDGEWFSLGPDFRIMVGRVPFYDSWSLTEAGGVRMLNLNDCVLHREIDLRRLVKTVGSVDLLMTQFSYANWVGGPDDVALRLEAAQEKLDWVAKQLAAIKPTFCVPFASFSIFAHEENAYLNDERNSVADAVQVIERYGVTPVVLYPGDRWTVGVQHDNAEAIKRYAEADDVSNRPLRSHASVPLENLRQLAEDYRQRVRSRNNRALLWLASWPPLHVTGPILIYLWDLDTVVRFDLAHGLQPVNLPAERAAVAMHSQSLSFTLKFDFGVDTLSVNGRFRGTAAAYRRLLRTFAVSVLNNNGRHLQFRLLTDRWLVRRAFERFVLRAS
jgi:UDP-MurNAc hydroxylase